MKSVDMGTRNPSMPPNMTPKHTGAGMKKIVTILILLVVILGVATFYFYRTSRLNKTDSIIDQKEAQALANKVGKLIVLPTDEVPTVATVSDPEALKDQAFFEGARKGDKVLIYTNAKKAVLYSPEINKIVNVAPLNTTESTNRQNPAPLPVPTPIPEGEQKTEF